MEKSQKNSRTFSNYSVEYVETKLLKLKLIYALLQVKVKDMGLRLTSQKLAEKGRS